MRRETAMILTIDRVNDLLDDMADSFPAALFDGLNEIGRASCRERV